VSHQSAAFLHSIDLLGARAADVTLTCPRRRGWHSRTGMRLHAAELPPEHVMVSDTGLRLTTPARTVIDLARTLDFRAGVVAADSALHSKLATKYELRSAVAACRRRSGIGQAEAVVDFADALAESPLESMARVVFRDCGLPAPILQAWLGGTAEPVGRVDFYWRRYRTVAEVDGAIKYADPSRARAQLRRDALLRADGYEVVHFDWLDITEKPCIRRRVDQDGVPAGPAHGGRAARRGLAARISAARGGAARSGRLASDYRSSIASIATRIRFSETGPGVPSTCANRLTRSSSISHRIATTSGRERSAAGSSPRAASYSAATR
jgi:hypothetical protein